MVLYFIGAAITRERLGSFGFREVEEKTCNELQEFHELCVSHRDDEHPRHRLKPMAETKNLLKQVDIIAGLDCLISS